MRRSPGSGRREKLAATSGRLMRLPVNVPLLYGFACPLLRDYVAFYVSFGPVKFGFSLFVIRLVSAVPPVDLRFPPRSEFDFFLNLAFICFEIQRDNVSASQCFLKRVLYKFYRKRNYFFESGWGSD